MLNHRYIESPFYYLPPFVGAAVFLSLALIAILRGKKNGTTRCFAGVCLLGAVINADIALVGAVRDAGLALRIDRIAYLAFVFSIPLYIQFVHAFLGIAERKWFELVAYGFSCILIQFVLTDLFIRGYHETGNWRIAEAGPVHAVFSCTAGLTVMYCLLLLTGAWRRASDNVRRHRIAYVIAGLGAGSFLLLLDTIPIAGFHVYPVGNFNFIPGIVLGIGVLKYDLLDIGVFMRKGAVYFMLIGILTLFSVVTLYGFNIVFMRFGGADSLVIPLLSAALIVFFFDPLRLRIRRLVDVLFFRGAYDYQSTLRKISDGMTSLYRIDDIASYVTQSLAPTLNVHSASLIVCAVECEHVCRYTSAHRMPLSVKRTYFEGWHEVARYLESAGRTVAASECERSNIPTSLKRALRQLFQMAGASLLVPVTFRGELTGVIVLGEKKSGELFVHEDTMLLNTVANQCAVAMENARAHERLEEINRELEARVAARTADLLRALEEKERTQEQLIRSESLASIGQLVAGVAHELNNPLASASSLIESSVELMQRGRAAFQVEDVIDDLAFSLRELMRAAHIVKSLLGLSRQTETHREPVDINRCIEDTVRVLRGGVRDRLFEIEICFDAALPFVEGNYAHMGQVFMNVIKNSIQSVQDGTGRITIQTSYRREKDRVIVECGDNGCGMTEEVLNDIFKPFFTTKKPGEGTGLGLYIAHEIIQRHGGNIGVRSVRGCGTTVTIELPCGRGGKP